MGKKKTSREEGYTIFVLIEWIIMADPKGNKEFCFTKTLNVPQGKARPEIIH